MTEERDDVLSDIIRQLHGMLYGARTLRPSVRNIFRRALLVEAFGIKDWENMVDLPVDCLREGLIILRQIQHKSAEEPQE